MTGYNFNSDKDRLVFLELSPILRSEGIVINFVARISSNKKTGGLIELQLNNKYGKKVIVSDIYSDSWTKTISKFRARAEEKGIGKEHRDMITDVLDNNAGKLIDISSQKQAEAQAEIVQAASSKDYHIAAALQMVKSKTVELFLEQVKKAYIAVREDEHTKTMSIHGAEFEKWITHTYYFETKRGKPKSSDGKDNDDKTKYDEASNTHRIDHDKYEKDTRHSHRFEVAKVLSDDEVSKVQKILSFEAEKAGKVKTLYVRVASFVDTSPISDLDSNVVYYDLCNPNWEIVKITCSGWSIEKNYPQILFKRYALMNAQIEPKHDYSPDILERFMKLTNVYDDYDNKLLAKVYMITLFLLANLPKPIMLPHGTQGSAKSTFQELTKKVVDPAAALTSAFPSSLAELVQQLDHSYLTFFDNVSEIKHLTSDALCRAVTGSGFIKRALYENDEDFVYNMKRAVGFNGINITASRPDLLERILNLELRPIDKRKRRKLEYINNEFDMILPQLLGFIFDIVVKVLSRIGEVKLEELPRMADFAEMGELVSRCLGYEDGKFTETYNRNIGFTNETAIESNSVAVAIIELMDIQPVWYGKTAGLLAELNDLVKGKRELTGMIYSKRWPKTPHALGDRLNEIDSSLKEAGIIVERKEDKHAKSKIITIINNNFLTKESAFWEAYEELEKEEAENPDNISVGDKNTISGTKLRQRLVSSGKFDSEEEAAQMITNMIKTRRLDEVSYDTYRRVRPAEK